MTDSSRLPGQQEVKEPPSDDALLVIPVRTLLAVLATVALVAAIVVVVLLSGDDPASKQVTSARAPTVLAAQGAEVPKSSLKIGEQDRLHGAKDVELVATVERVLDPLPGGPDDEPAEGKRFVGVVVRLTNTGNVQYKDAPAQGAGLTYGDARDAAASTVGAGPCSSGFSSQTEIVPEAKAKGCFVFEVPNVNTIQTFSLTLDSGFANESGLWNIRAANKSNKTVRRTSPAAVPQPQGTQALHACDQNISAGVATTCQFANEVFKDYAAQIQRTGGSNKTVTVFSSAVGGVRSVECAYDGKTVTCVGPSDTKVTFPKWAADVY